MKNGNFKIAVVAFAFLISNFALHVYCQSETPPKPGEPHVATIPTPVEKTLPNGLRVIVVERKNVPLVTAQIMIKSGGEIDPPNLAGAADMTAELLTKGTKTRTASQIAEQMEFLGGSINSGAGWDYSSVTFRVMSDKFDKAMEIAADTVLNPTFAQDEIDRYKTQTLDELSVNLRQPGTLASYVANAVAFGDQAYGHPLGGTPESIKRLTRIGLLKIHSNYFKPNNAVVVIAGDIAPETAFEIVNKNFEKWTGKFRTKKPKNFDVRTELIQPVNETPESSAKKQIKASQITVIDLPKSGQSAVLVAQYSISRNDETYFQGLVANSVLGGGYSARLNQEIRIKRGLSYGAGSNISARRDGGIFITRAQTKNESAAEVAEVMINELDRLSNQPIADIELEPRKAVLVGNFSRDLETTNGLVDQISHLVLYGLNLDEINTYVQSVNNIGEDKSRRFIANLFYNDGANIIIVGDAVKFLPDLQKRFPSIKINVIPAAQLDLNNATLRKPKLLPRARQNAVRKGK